MRISETSANNPKHAPAFDVGDHFTYPDYHWNWICKVPDIAALDWVRSAAPHTTIGPIVGVTAETVTSAHQWLNKLAVIVEVERGTLALYKHDFAIWLIKLNVGE